MLSARKKAQTINDGTQGNSKNRTNKPCLIVSHWHLEQFSIECRKTKTKVITLTNHNRRRQFNEPIRTRSKCMSSTSSAGKRMRAGHDWFWFYFRLVGESRARFFNQSQGVAIQNQSNCEITFDTQLKPALKSWCSVKIVKGSYLACGGIMKCTFSENTRNLVPSFS